MQPSRQALLLGAGHAHLYTLKRAREYRRRGDTVTVVGPARFWYSGLATGVLGGEYDADADQIDIPELAAAGGARFVDAQVHGIDASERTVSLGGGPPLHYDVLSLNLGSVVEALPGENGNAAVFPVKPIRKLWALRQFLEALFDSEHAAAIEVLVAGGGATGCEIAANVVGLAERRAARVAVTIVTEGSRVLERSPESAARDIERFLRARGVAIRCNTRVLKVDAGRAVLSDGTAVRFDAAVNATGLKPSPLIRSSGLAVSDEGALLVDTHLRSVGDRHIFGGGDCIAIEDHPLPKIGVYAVRQAPILHRNLLTALHGGRTKPFKPQRHFLSIMNLGDGTALATRARLWWHGRGAFRLKDWIDRRFMQAYR